MEFEGKMFYLGTKFKKSEKSGKQYLLVSFMHHNENGEPENYEFYVPSDRLELTTKLGTLTLMKFANLKFKMSSYNMKPQIDLEDVELKESE